MKKMKISNIISLFVLFVVRVTGKDCLNKSNSKLFCYYSRVNDADPCKCSHIILPANSDTKLIDSLREIISGVKILLTVQEFNEGLVSTVKNTKIDGLELNLRKLDSRTDISDFITTVRLKLGSDLIILLSVPSKTELLAKYFDFKALSKRTDFFILQTGFLGVNKNVTFHPSRLSGLWDMQNADSMVDLVSGLGAPLSKLVVIVPVQALHFTLENEDHTAPGSRALNVATLTRDQLCNKMLTSNWTLERDQDQAGPYIFRKNDWIAFDDAISVDIKAKYSRVRGLAGLALKDVNQDGGQNCGGSLLDAAFNGLSKQSRAPRGAVLHSLEREILQEPVGQLNNIHMSPYRISRIIDVDGKVHAIRQDTRTEFKCSRQGYFVHPKSCGRFYRCVKFDQLTDEYSVFEFDCPVGLAFDNRVEVCVWPGSLPHASPCTGSSEIAPVPKERFICPAVQGYYADPENCRWFFACMDQGESSPTAYEFRCPFGLVFDEQHLLCEWPWLVPKCGSGVGSSANLGLYQPSVSVYGGSILARAHGFDLEHYDGLGSLELVALGGAAGHLEQPVAKVHGSFATHLENQFIPLQHTVGSTGTNAVGGPGVLVGKYKQLKNMNGVNARIESSEFQEKQNFDSPLNQGSPEYISLLNNAQRGTVKYLSTARVDVGQYSVRSDEQSSEAGKLSYQDDRNINSIGFKSTTTHNFRDYSSADNSELAARPVLSSNGISIKFSGGPRGFVRYQYDGGIASESLNSGQITGYSTQLESNKPSSSLIADITNYNEDLVTSRFSAANVQGINDRSTSQNLLSVTYHGNRGINSSQLAHADDSGQEFQNSNSEIGRAVDLSRDILDSRLASTRLQEYNSFGGHNIENIAAYGDINSRASGKSIYSPRTALSQEDLKYDSIGLFGNANGKSNQQSQAATENIDVKGGAFSATKLELEPKSGVQLTHHGIGVDFVGNETPVPISVIQSSISTSHIPVVKSVPGIRTRTGGFQFHKSGVVAHYPELQSKLDSPKVISDVYHHPVYLKGTGDDESSTPSTSFASASVTGYKSSTVTPILIAVTGTSLYFKPTAFLQDQADFELVNAEPTFATIGYRNHHIQEAVKTANSGYAVSAVNVSEPHELTAQITQPFVLAVPTPPTVLVQNSAAILPLQVTRPSIVPLSFQSVQAVGNSYDYHKSQNYVHKRPSVDFEEEPQKSSIVISYAPPKLSSINVQPSQINPLEHIVPVPLLQQPIGISSYRSYQDTNEPDNIFRKVPQSPRVISTFSISQPVAENVTFADDLPAINVESIHNVTLEHIVPIQPAIQPVSVSLYNYQYSAHQGEGYAYNKQPVVVNHHFKQTTFESPSGAQTYGYRNPVVAFEEKQPIISEQLPINSYQMRPSDTSYYSNKNIEKVVEPQNFDSSRSIDAIINRNAEDVALPNTYALKPTAATSQKIKAAQIVELESVSARPAAGNYYHPLKPLITTQPAVVNSNRYYNYPKTSIQFVGQPVSLIKHYENLEQSKEVPFESRNAYETGYEKTKVENAGYIYKTPKARFEEKPNIIESYSVSSSPAYKESIHFSPKPLTFTSTIRPLINKYVLYQPTTPTSLIAPANIDVYISSTAKPTYASTIASVVEKLRPNAENPVSNLYSYDSRFASTPKHILQSTPLPNRPEVPITQSRPISRYSFTSLPSVYGFVSDNAMENYESKKNGVTEKWRTPVKVIKVMIPKSQAIVKINDFHPLLAAKLGAQCTCLSNTLKLKNKSVRVQTYHQDDYVVKPADDYDGVSVPNNLKATGVENSTNSVMIEDYKFNPQAVAEITPTPDVIHSTSALPIIRVHKRIRIKPYTSNISTLSKLPATEVTDMFLKGTASPNFQNIGDQGELSQANVENVVLRGLKLIKAAAKEGAKEALAEHAYDRFGSGGVRSRDEILQGTVDCQRAGLFRHPTRCNKFYACRWDCTKKRFTLHVFNCPVHLTFDNNLAACNWPSRGPACLENTLLPSD